LFAFAPTGNDDRHICRNFVEGDPNALRQVNRWIRGVVYCRYRFSSEDADDLTSESILHLFAYLSKPETKVRESCKAVVRDIAAKRCIELIRRNKRNKETSTPTEILEFLSPDFWTNYGTYETLQIVDLLKKAMSKLTYVCRTVLKLRYFDGLQYNEMAKRLDRQEGTCKANVSRCLDDLHDNFTELLKEDDLDRTDILRGLD